jgi:hypothetical protein
MRHCCTETGCEIIHTATCCCNLFQSIQTVLNASRGNVVVKTLCYKSNGLWFETRRDHWISFKLPNHSRRTRLWGLLSLYEYEKQKKLCLWGVECGRCVGLTTLPPSVSRPSRQCRFLNISQSPRSPRPFCADTFSFSFTEVKLVVHSDIFNVFVVVTQSGVLVPQGYRSVSYSKRTCPSFQLCVARHFRVFWVYNIRISVVILTNMFMAISLSLSV